MAADIYEVCGYRLSDVRISPIRKTERDVTSSKLFVHGGNEPGCIAHFYNAEAAMAGTLRLQSLPKNIKPAGIDLEPRRQMKKDWS